MEISSDNPDDAIEGNAPPHPYVSDRSFGDHLKWHLFVNGTRPSGTLTAPGKPWSRKEFADIVVCSTRHVGNWIKNISAPHKTTSIERALFGDDKSYRDWRYDLRNAALLLHSNNNISIDAEKINIQAGAHRLPPRVGSFIGRDQYIDFCKKQLISELTPAPALLAAVHNIGGVGKTSLALEFAHRFQNNFSGVWWCPADSAEALERSLARIAVELEIVDKSTDNRSFAAFAAFNWLNSNGGPWLIVYDNVSDPTIIARFIPKKRISLLITSRFSDWSGICSSVCLDDFYIEEAVTLLNRVAGRTDCIGAQELAVTLGCLPLAINQAAVTCRRMNLSFIDYKANYDRLIEAYPGSTEYPISVYGTFEMAISELPKGHPALEMLVVLFYCNPYYIHSKMLESLFPSISMRTAAILQLIEMSFLKARPEVGENRIYSIHRLIQAVGRRGLEKIGDLSEEFKSVNAFTQNYVNIATSIFEGRYEYW